MSNLVTVNQRAYFPQEFIDKTALRNKDVAQVCEDSEPEDMEERPCPNILLSRPQTAAPVDHDQLSPDLVSNLAERSSALRHPYASSLQEREGRAEGQGLILVPTDQ
jgi:hypothetical protein